MELFKESYQEYCDEEHRISFNDFLTTSREKGLPEFFKGYFTEHNIEKA